VFALGIVNLLLAFVGIYFLLSAGWQDLRAKQSRRIKSAWACWGAAILLGTIAWLTNG